LIAVSPQLKMLSARAKLKLVNSHAEAIRRTRDRNTMSKEKAKVRRKVVAYLGKHGHADTGELLMELEVPLELLFEVVADLKREGKVTGAPVVSSVAFSDYELANLLGLLKRSRQHDNGDWLSQSYTKLRQIAAEIKLTYTNNFGDRIHYRQLPVSYRDWFAKKDAKA